MAYRDSFSGYRPGTLSLPAEARLYGSYKFNRRTGTYTFVGDHVSPTQGNVYKGQIWYSGTNGASSIRVLNITGFGATTATARSGTRSAVYTVIDTYTIAGYGEENVIDKDNVAMVRDFVLGHTYGIISGFGTEVEAGIQGNNAVKITSGELYAYGYVASLPEAVTFNYLLPSVEQYWFIYGEIDMSRVPNTFTIKTKNNGRSTNVTWRQDVLSSIKTGVFQMPLCQVKLTSEGIAELKNLNTEGNAIKTVYHANTAKVCTGELNALDNYVDFNSGIQGGTDLSGDLVWLDYEFDRKTGTYSVVGDGISVNTLKIGDVCYGKPFVDEGVSQIEEYHIERIYDGDVRVAYAPHKAIKGAVTAVTQDINDNSTKVATTEFVINKLLSDNGTMREATISFKNLRQSVTDNAQEGWVRRKYDFVIGKIYLKGYTKTENGVAIATIPLGYRPQKTITQYAGYSEAAAPRTAITITIDPNGEVTTTGTTMGFFIEISFGYQVGG